MHVVPWNDMQKRPCSHVVLQNDMRKELSEMTQILSEMTPIFLNHVVRNSQRIVAGAAPFQLDGTKRETLSSHRSSGPYLKSYSFPPEFDVQTMYATYAKRTVEAIVDISESFSSSKFNYNRLMPVCPKSEFRESFEAQLSDTLFTVASDQLHLRRAGLACA